MAAFTLLLPISSPFAQEKSAASIAQADADLRKRIEQAAGILKGLDQQAKLAKRTVPQAGAILDPFSGLLTTKPPRHDGVSGGLFWRLSAVHWQLEQAGKQSAKSSPPSSVGGLPVDSALVGQVQAVKTLALTGKIRDDILTLRKSADAGLGKFAETLWGRNEKTSSIALDGFRKESISGLEKAARLLQEGLKAHSLAQKNYLLNLAQGLEEQAGAGKKTSAAASGKGGASNRDAAEKKPGSYGGKTGKEASAPQSSASGMGGEGSSLPAGGLGKGGAKVASAAAPRAQAETPASDRECLNANALSDSLTACGSNEQCLKEAWGKCKLIRKECSNSGTVLANMEKCYDDAVEGPIRCPKCTTDQLNQQYFDCRTKAAKLCVPIGAKPPTKCVGEKISDGKGGCVCSGKLVESLDGSCVKSCPKDQVIVTGKCQPCPKDQIVAGNACKPSCDGKNPYDPKTSCCSGEKKILEDYFEPSPGTCEMKLRKDGCPAVNMACIISLTDTANRALNAAEKKLIDQSLKTLARTPTGREDILSKVLPGTKVFDLANSRKAGIEVRVSNKQMKTGFAITRSTFNPKDNKWYASIVLDPRVLTSVDGARAPILGHELRHFLDRKMGKYYGIDIFVEAGGVLAEIAVARELKMQKLLCGDLNRLCQTTSVYLRVWEDRLLDRANRVQAGEFVWDFSKNWLKDAEDKESFKIRGTPALFEIELGLNLSEEGMLLSSQEKAAFDALFKEDDAYRLKNHAVLGSK